MYTAQRSHLRLGRAAVVAASFTGFSVLLRDLLPQDRMTDATSAGRLAWQTDIVSRPQGDPPRRSAMSELADKHRHLSDAQILAHINDLETEERELRARLRAGALSPEAEQSRLAALEVEIDQYWDLLRQRRAKSAAHQNPDEAQVRSPAQVEGYEG
jgi:hypothetical protein